MTEDTGRIRVGLGPTARRIVFGDCEDEAALAELRENARVDRAHLLMLAGRGLLDEGRARALLGAIEELRRADFAPLQGRQAPRGLYLMYEGYLIERLGAEVGGALQLGRSRNDLKATTLRLSVRKPYSRLTRELLRLQAVILRRARRYAGVTMPAYTHYQAAVPVSLGHYLAGVSFALSRDVEALLALAPDLNRSPLGAGAVGGTSLPIDAALTASLLGFEEPPWNSFDAVASRDLVLRLLAAVVVMGVTLSRLSSDLLLWTTAEFNFLTLPDHLVGSSSMMPQKRNPFLLEHAEGKSAAALGAFVAAATAMHATPFTNSVAAGTEAVSHLWGALRQATDAITLLRLVVADARPNEARMSERAARGYTVATELANRLVSDAGLSFRTAHRRVGEAISRAVALEESAGGAGQEHDDGRLGTLLDRLDPASVARAAVFGGGPGPAALGASLSRLRESWQQQSRRRRVVKAGWAAAEQRLNEAQERLRSGAPA